MEKRQNLFFCPRKSQTWQPCYILMSRDEGPTLLSANFGAIFANLKLATSDTGIYCWDAMLQRVNIRQTLHCSAMCNVPHFVLDLVFLALNLKKAELKFENEE